MKKNENKIREKLKYLLECDNIYSPETDTATEAEVTNLYIPTWVDEDISQEMLEYISSHPNASLRELVNYENSITSPLEIVDTDEDEDAD